MSVFVGVDIAAKTFDLVNRKGGKASKVESFSQSPQGARQSDQAPPQPQAHAHHYGSDGNLLL